MPITYPFEMQVLVFLIRLDSLAKPNTYCKIPFLQMSNL